MYLFKNLSHYLGLRPEIRTSIETAKDETQATSRSRSDRPFLNVFLNDIHLF
jgi:hypothetical protein